MTAEAAADAAGTAIALAWTYGNPPGALPSAAKAREWADESVTDPYNRDTPYQ